MFTIKQPPKIIFGNDSAHNYAFPKYCLIITSKGAISRGWMDYLGMKDYHIFDGVEPNPSIGTVETIISQFKDASFSHVVGLGGGSSLDVAKFVAYRMNKNKIMIPTTFGSGSEVTQISVLKVDNRKQSFHDDNLLTDVAIVDPFFIKNSPLEVIKNSAVDACAQCTEAFDSKIANSYTKLLCQKAFDVLEDGILNENYEKLPFGSLICGLGFGNSSTTLGHALSYIFSNEGISHGHALAFTTTVAHRFNKSVFYERFLKIIHKLDFQSIGLKQNLEKAAELILTDRKHIDNNPKKVTKKDLIFLLEIINTGKALDPF